MERRMHSVVHACTCRNNWDGFGICLNATGQYYDGEPNLITDEQFETFLRGGESPESPPRLRLTQDLTLLMDLHDEKRLQAAAWSGWTSPFTLHGLLRQAGSQAALRGFVSCAVLSSYRHSMHLRNQKEAHHRNCAVGRY